MEVSGVPIGRFLLVMIGMPLVLAVVFGVFAFKGMTPHAFRCRRCDREFRRRPYRRFPRRCPRCGARDWNL